MIFPASLKILLNHSLERVHGKFFIIKEVRLSSPLAILSKDIENVFFLVLIEGLLFSKIVSKVDANLEVLGWEYFGNINYLYLPFDKKTNKYVELTYKQMTSEQKKSVINRIMTDNAHSAKIYVYTQSGGKYYTTNEEELARLKKLGISNVYKSTKNETYFN